MKYTVWNIPREAWTHHPDLERLVITDRVIAAFLRDYKPDPREAMFECCGGSVRANPIHQAVASGLLYVPPAKAGRYHRSACHVSLTNAGMFCKRSILLNVFARPIEPGLSR